MRNTTPTTHTKTVLQDSLSTLCVDSVAGSDTTQHSFFDTIWVERQAYEREASHLFIPPTHQVIEIPVDSMTYQHEGMYAEQIPSTIAGNHWVILLLIAVFVFFSISYGRGAKYLSHVFSSLFKIQTRGNLFDETTINENQLRASLLTLTFVTEGIAMYYLLLHNITAENLLLPALLASIAVCTLYYFAQLAIYHILGNIFSSTQQTEGFIESFISVNLLIGLFCTPLVLLMIFIPSTIKIATILCIVFYIASRLVIIYKGIRFFLLHYFGLLYIILYLCALEFSPLFLIEKAVIELYKFIELIFITP